MNQTRFVIFAVLLDLLIGCGSVAELAIDAGASADVVRPSDDAGAALDAAPPDTLPGNPSDGAAESSPTAACVRNGSLAVVAQDCSSSCAACHWPGWDIPAPDGCALPTGVICRPDCAACR